MTTTTTTPTQADLEARLVGQRMALGRARKALGERLADGLDTTEASATVEMVQKRIDELEAGIETFKQRGLDAMEAEKAERERQAQLIEINIRQQIYDLVLEGDGHIAVMKGWGARMIAAVNAGRTLGDRTLGYECSKVVNSLKPHLGFALRGFPGMDTGLSPFLKLDQQSYASTFPDPKTSAPPRKPMA